MRKVLEGFVAGRGLRQTRQGAVWEAVALDEVPDDTPEIYPEQTHRFIAPRGDGSVQCNQAWLITLPPVPQSNEIEALKETDFWIRQATEARQAELSMREDVMTKDAEVEALREDAETLRTAVRLGISIQQSPLIGEGFAKAGENMGFYTLSEAYGDDPMGATRRTVARAVEALAKLENERSEKVMARVVKP